MENANADEEQLVPPEPVQPPADTLSSSASSHSAPAASELTQEQAEMVHEYQTMFGTDAASARHFLQLADWDLQRAIFDADEQGNDGFGDMLPQPQPAPEPATEADSESAAKLARLLELGFDRPTCEAALEQAGGDVKVAANLLASGFSAG